MSFINAIFRFLKKILDTIKKVLGKIFKRFGILLLLFVIACFIFPGFLPALLAMVGVPGSIVSAVGTVFGTTGIVASWGIWGQVAAAVGVAAMVSPGTVKKAAGNVGDAAKDIVDNVGDVATGVVDNGGKVVDSVLDNVGNVLTHPVVLLGVGGFLLYMLMKDNDSNEIRVVTDSTPSGQRTSNSDSYSVPRYPSQSDMELGYE